jgi:uridine kinase
MKPFIIGVAGSTCSGKTTFACHMKSISPSKITIINQDSYYKDLLPNEDAKNKNFDDPVAIDWDLLMDNIIQLKNGKTVLEPIYDFNTHKRLNKYNVTNPTPIIIVEGIFVLYTDKLVKLLDRKIYMDSESDVRYRRRLKRDVCERGRTDKQVDYQWDTFVKPSHNKFIEETKNNADIILRNNIQIDNIKDNNIINFDIVDVYIRHVLEKYK